MRNYFMLLLISTVFIFNSCKKGEQGPQGEKGESGNAVKTFIYSNKKIPFATLTRTDSYGGKTYYRYEGKLEITPPVTDYQDYYENGLVLIFLRNSNYQNGVWIGVNDENASIHSGWDDDNYGVSIIVDDAAITKEKIIIEGESIENNNGGGTQLKSFLFDIKVVLVPTSSVTKLSSVDTKDLKAVEKALRLY